MQLDQGASVEIARNRDPLAALPATTRLLVKRDQPIAFAGISVSEKIGVGRAGAIDDADSAQKIDPAARLVICKSGPLSK